MANGIDSLRNGSLSEMSLLDFSAQIMKEATIDDLDPAVLRTIDNVGITAGASTPNKIIEEVQNNVRNEF